MGSTLNTVAIIQARMSSKRLPGKVLLDLAGKKVLTHVVERVSAAKLIDNVVVATSTDESDNPIQEWTNLNNINCFRGSLHDVLSRFYGAATEFKADRVVRITADCPAIDPMIIDEVINHFEEGAFDYSSLSGEFPDGLDCTIFSYDALSRTFFNAKLPSEREHVGPFMEKNTEIFKVGQYHKFKGLGFHRWTLDEPKDYLFLKRIFENLSNDKKLFLYKDILDLLEREPDLLQINQDIKRNEGYLKSLENDGKI